MYSKTTFLLWISSALTLPFVTAQLRDDIQFQWNSVKMPLNVSDVTANYVQGENGDEDGFVIITGGCNSPNGNERVTIGGQDLFTCTSTSNVTLKFDPFANTFEEMAEMPHARQRHTAAVMNGEVYVFGGRDSNDSLVAAIDSYDPNTNVWKTRGELPEDVVTSDLTAWSWKNYIYVTGGFLADYTSVGTTYRLDMMESPTDFESMGYEKVTSSSTPRGDFHAVELYGYAYLSGGISHLSKWCKSLKTTERYHMETDTWEPLSDLTVGRADMAVAVLNGKIVSVGGETKPDVCEFEDAAYGSFPEDQVEVLLNPGAGKGAEWVRFADFIDERFRFAAAVVPAQNRIYTFGGQLPYDFTCDCFPTSDDVGIGTEVYQPEQKMSAGAIAGIVIASVVGVGFALFMLRRLCKNRREMSIESPTEFESSKEAAAV